ncbi:hypothetical protein ZIOFF_001600 [Zingiber officinale]|uniref:Phospholipid/glycerol acyltransferase domain-containing protein n=1 Tax=Zingiber officinale TaxID=94328 RepID=A0A8J5HVM5_ZINOF|nr:hypothetical protein ZIOFF_001600 [Zingiber officinale]
MAATTRGGDSRPLHTSFPSPTGLPAFVRRQLALSCRRRPLLALAARGSPRLALAGRTWLWPAAGDRAWRCPAAGGRAWLSIIIVFNDNLVINSLKNHQEIPPTCVNEFEKSYAVVSNHISYVDILYHTSSAFPSFVAKRSVAQLPLVGVIRIGQLQ